MDEMCHKKDVVVIRGFHCLKGYVDKQEQLTAVANCK